MHPEDSALIKSATELVFSTLNKNPDEAIDIASQVLMVAQKHALYETQARMYLYLGIANDFKGMYEDAFIKYDQGLRITQAHHLESLQGDIYNNYSITKAITGQLETSIEYALKALAIFEKQADSTSLAKIFNNLGSRYSEMNLTEKALEYYLLAAKMNERRGDDYRLAHNYGNIGLLYYEMNMNGKSLEYFQRSLKLQDTIANRKDYSIALHYLALAYEHLENYDTACYLEKRSLKIAAELGDDLGKIPPLRGMSTIALKLNRPQKALEYLTEAEAIAEKMGARYYLVNIYEELATTYGELGKFREAFDYNRMYNELNDSIQSLEKNKAISLLQKFDEEKNQHQIELLTRDSEIQKLNVKRQKTIRNSVALVGILLLILVIGVFSRYRYVRKTRNELATKNQIINREKDRSDELLLNILPAETAEELKQHGRTEARYFDMVTVMFTDFQGFTYVAEKLQAHELVSEIDYCFKNFDEIISKYGIEKIKTIGDAYMCAGGLPVPNETNPADVVRAAIEIQQFMKQLKEDRKAEGRPWFELRIGVHTGPVVAGVVGIIKYQYDIWGDTVNIASRMESSSEVGKVNISQTTYEKVKDQFNCSYRGKIKAKNKGEVDMYFVKMG